MDHVLLSGVEREGTSEMLYVAKDARVRLSERRSLQVLRVFNAPNIGEQLTLP